MPNLPSSPYPKRGEVEPNQALLDQLMPALREAAIDMAELMIKHHFDEGKTTIRGNDELAGDITYKREPQGQGLSLELSGTLGGNLPQFRGTPFLADYIGEFYLREPGGTQNFVADGQKIAQGKMVGWAVGEAKDQQWGVRTEVAGTIHFAVNDGDNVQEDTVLFYIEASS